MRGLLAAGNSGRRTAAAAARNATSTTRSISFGSLRTASSKDDSNGANSGGGGWTDESPQGGVTEVYVYRPEQPTAVTRWPDPALGVFGQRTDPRFALPGDVGPSSDLLVDAEAVEAASKKSSLPSSLAAYSSDVLSRPTNVENQAQVLYTANDFLQHTPGSESTACCPEDAAPLLDRLPSIRGVGEMRCEVHEAPHLIRKEAKLLFPDTPAVAQACAASSPLSVLTVTQRTEHDMSAWSAEMEEERERRTAAFVGAAKEICARLASEGVWADFIDPGTGTPFYGGGGASGGVATMFETDEKYRLLGFRIEDLGCCKVICHRDFGRNVLVGSVFTTAHVSNPAIEDILADLEMEATSKASTAANN